jgi:hypothetical protein
MKTAFMLLSLTLLSAQGVFSQSSAPGGGGDDRVMHHQHIHQYIVLEAFKILQEVAPAQAAKLEDHIGTLNTPSAPWVDRTISAGAYREDEEDVCYGYGGPIFDYDPAVLLHFSTSACPGQLHYEIEQGLKNDADFRKGLVTSTHFWDPDAQNTVLWGLYGISGLGVFDCLDDLSAPHTNACDRNAPRIPGPY